MNKLSAHVNTSAARIGAAVGLVFAVMGFAQVAHADVISDAFASAQTSLLAYIALGIGVIVALLLAGIGVRLLVKYVRKAASAA